MAVGWVVDVVMDQPATIPKGCQITAKMGAVVSG
jgi:hypothetical protein